MVNVVETVVDFALKQVVGQKKENFQNNNNSADMNTQHGLPLNTKKKQKKYFLLS